jgi:sulfate adenylyltransferase subunit 1 (EFTu-like GTPase family)
VVWFDQAPLDPSKEYLLKHTTRNIRARVESATVLKMNDIGEVRIALAQPVFFDSYKSNRITGSFILIDRETNATAAAGMIK